MSVPFASTIACGAAGRPLYRDAIDAAYAPVSAIATRSPRRNGGRAALPNESVDSQIGPSTRAWTSASPSTARPSEVRAATGWSAP